MNENLRRLIRAVAENNTEKAKVYVKVILDEDKTQANRGFCSMIKNMLQSSSMNLMELPHDIRGILHMEDVSASFNINRYYLSDRESKIADEVSGMYQTSQRLSEMGIQYLNSLLLHGKSGTGKTLFGKYIAYKLGLPFVYMNFSNAISSYLGSTGKNISKAFEFIEKQKCVFMIDELDAIGIKRGEEKEVGEIARITISLMQALDCVRNDTVILGATNRLDMIDPALLRRFTMMHEVTALSKSETETMICDYLRDVGVPYELQDIQEYCKNQRCQAAVINDVVRAIARSIRYNDKFLLSDYTQQTMLDVIGGKE
ncbi:MAG: ATP-binding protein [Smithella sp.]